MNKLFLNNLPASPGVYKMLDDNKDIIYVGKAGNLKKRVRLCVCIRCCKEIY